VCWDGLGAANDELGFAEASGRDEVFRHLVLARIIEPTNKLDSLRMLVKTEIDPALLRDAEAALPAYAAGDFRGKLATGCAGHARLGPASLVLIDVSMLYLATVQGEGFREPGFFKERRLEPQITIELLTDAAGFPLMVQAFEGERAETTTMLPTIAAFMATYQPADVTVVADAGDHQELERFGRRVTGSS
jgi:hypothetical protein